MQVNDRPTCAQQMSTWRATIRLTWVTVMALLSSAGAFAQAEPTSPQALEAVLQSVAKSYKQAIAPGLTKAEQGILAEIAFEVERTRDIKAVALKIHGQRKVVVSYGWLHFAREFMLADAISAAKRSNCLESFAVAVAAAASDNRARMQASEPRRPLPALESFAKADGSVCGGANPMSRRDPAAAQAVERGMDAAMMWVIGRLIAMHLQGHADRTLPADSAEHAQMHQGADAWSIEHAWLLRANLLPAHPAVLLDALTNTVRAAYTADTTDTAAGICNADVRRYGAFLSALSKRLSDRSEYEKVFDFPMGETMPYQVNAIILRARCLPKRPCFCVW